MLCNRATASATPGSNEPVTAVFAANRSVASPPVTHGCSMLCRVIPVTGSTGAPS